MRPFLVFPTGVGVFRSHRNYTPANVGPAALSALAPDLAVTVAPGQTAQPSRVLQKKALAASATAMLPSSWVPCSSPLGYGLFPSPTLNFSRLFIHVYFSRCAL